MSDSPRDRIREFFSTPGRSLKAASEAIGLNHAYLQQYVQRGTPRELPERVREALSTIMQISPDELRGSDAPPRVSATKRANVDLRTIRTEGIVGENDLPVYASAEGAQGGQGAMLFSYDAIEVVKRPEPLMGVKGGFGMYCVGDSMSPAYEPGDFILVHPTRPAFAGEDVLVVMQERKEDWYVAMVKRLVSQNDRTIRLLQHNPQETFEVPRSQVLKVHLVVGNYRKRR